MLRTLLATGLALWIAIPSVAEDYRVATSEQAPEGLSEAVTNALSAQAIELTGPKRGYATLWLAKSVAIPADFQPTSAIKYPFASGALIGAVSIPKRAGFTDFRGNELEAGVYTLRYGRQPMDGNHIGTSDLADFLVAIPAKQDEDPAVLTDVQELTKRSAAASGTPHPAILSLQPTEKLADKPQLAHDEEREFWILDVRASVQRGDKSDLLPLRLVVVGVSEG